MKYRYGVDLGATNIAVGLVDETGAILGREVLPANPPRTAEEICDDIAFCCRSAAQKAGIRPEEVSFVGVAAPGMCDHVTGELIFANNLFLYHTPLCEMMQNRLGIPCKIENDANAAAYGEFCFGSAKEYSSVLMVTLGTGVGGGILLDGKIYTGAFFAGAEIGHIPMVFGGRTCNCGRRGCVETYCSATGLIQTTKEAMEANPQSLLWQICPSLDLVNGKTAFDGAKKGDKAACEVVELYTNQLADALSGYINFIEPEVLLLGGGIAKQGDALLVPLREKVSRLVYDRYAPKQTELRTASLGNDAGIIGAAFLDRAAYIESNPK